MASPKWQSRERDYSKELKLLSVQMDPVTNHPLKPSVIVSTSVDSKSNKKKKTYEHGIIDPLSKNQSDASEAVDPLSMFAAESATTVASKNTGSSANKEESGQHFILDEFALEPWSSKRLGILSKYTTSEKLSITTSFLSDADRVVIKQQTTVSDKVKHRLGELHDLEEGSVKEMLNLSQQEFVRRIEQFNQELIAAWENEQKVKALKIAIQCAKMLASVAVIGFYPSKFVLITDVLDTFGRLVYERLLRKSATLVSGTKILKMLPDNFAPEDVTDVAKETCRNWFYKIASIRELIPRFYVETSILKCYRFLTSGEYDNALVRLTKTIRGIGDPLVATYARCYICRVGILVAPGAKSHLRGSLLDFFFTYKQLQTDTVQNILAKQNTAPSDYLQLYSPALDWIVQCIAFKSPEDVLTEILNHCRKECNSALILNSIVSAFRPSYISARALEFVKIISECEDAGFPKYQLYRSLGMNVVLDEPPEAQRLQLLNDVWKVVMKLNSPAEYISCAEIWVEYPIKYFGKREIDTLLGDILKHLTVDRAFENYYPQLLSILSKVLSGLHDFSLLFSMNNFLRFLDLFQKDSVKTDACRLIMEAFCRYQTESTDDPVIVNGLMFVCKTLHDSVSSLTLADEKRATGQLVTGFLRKIDYGRDFEQQLNFYVEARASFCNLDPVLVCLVQCVNLLSMKTREIVKGNHTRKTAAFIRACVAFSFITIPSIQDIFNRLTLYLESGKVAFANQALSQGDAFLKAAVSLLLDVPKTIEVDNKTKPSEPFLLSYVNNFLSFLLVVPDHPDQGVLYLVRGLLNVIEDYNWDSQSDVKMKVYLNVISLLSAMTQETYFYHMEKVDSNDSMYGNDRKFIAEVHKIISTIVEEILKHLQALSGSEAKKRQAPLALEFFNRLMGFADLTSEDMCMLAINLWNLAQNNGENDTKLMARTYEFLKKKGKTRPDVLSLLGKLPLISRA